MILTPSKVQRANDTAHVATICTVNKGSRKMMQAKRGIRQHGGPIELELVRRNWTTCTDAAARVSHREGGLVDDRYESWPKSHAQIMHENICNANEMHGKMKTFRFGE